MKKYFALKDGIVLVKGAKRGLIYDLINKRLFSIDEFSKIYINELINGKSIKEALTEFPHCNKEKLIKYLDLLCKSELGYYTNNKTISGKINFNKNIKKEITTVWFELRKACNLKCCHCYMDSNYNSDKELNLLTIDDWKHIVCELVPYKPKRIILIGGEPLMFNETLELIKYSSEKLTNTEIVLYSNITMLKDDLIKVIREKKVKVVTSIYSNKESIHDKITNTKGSFNKTVSNIKKLKALGVFVKANVVVMKYNCDNIKDILEFTYKLTGVKSKVDIIRNIGHDKEDLLPRNISCEYNNKKHKPLFNGIDTNRFIRNFSGNSCYQGKINIECNGRVTPCIMSGGLLSKEYNIKDYTINEILDKYLIPEFWSISKDFIDICKDCEYRYVCKDCRPVNGEACNKYAKGNNCSYNPYSGKWE